MKGIRIMAALFSGLLFGAGLVLSGMASPVKVLGFLRLGPGWDPSLGFVMAGALAIALPGFQWLQRHGKPLLAEGFPGAPGRRLDPWLIAGAALFGAGWGLIGYCPGPAIVAAGLGQLPALLFLGAMLAGGWLGGRLQRRLSA